MRHFVKQLDSILEGFSLDIANYDTNSYLVTRKDGQVVFQDPATLADNFKNLLRRPKGQASYNSVIEFTDYDKPGDIVKTAAAMKSANLRNFIDPEHLPSVANCKIFYAFVNSDKDDYRDPALAAFFQPLEAAIKEYDIDGNTTYAQLKGLLAQEVRTLQIGMGGSQEYVNAYRATAKTIQDLYDKLQIGKPLLDNTSINQMINRLEAYCVKPHVIKAAYQFAKQIKKPLTQQDSAMQEKFIELTLRQFEKMVKNLDDVSSYDFVVMPDSSSQFNQLLANKLSNIVGAVAVGPNNIQTQNIINVTKLPASQVKFDREQMYDYALKKAKRDRRTGKFVLTTRGEHADKQMFDKPEEYARAWADNEYRKLVDLINRLYAKNPNKAINIKDIPQDKRRFAKIFDPQSMGAFSQMAGKSLQYAKSLASGDIPSSGDILLIDDNVVGGATIELVYELLTNLPIPPRRIDVFVPLRIVGW